MACLRRSIPPVPIQPHHRRTWRSFWQRCTCGLTVPCIDRLVPATRLPYPPETDHQPLSRAPLRRRLRNRLAFHRDPRNEAPATARHRQTESRLQAVVPVRPSRPSPPTPAEAPGQAADRDRSPGAADQSPQRPSTQSQSPQRPSTQSQSRQRPFTQSPSAQRPFTQRPSAQSFVANAYRVGNQRRPAIPDPSADRGFGTLPRQAIDRHLAIVPRHTQSRSLTVVPRRLGNQRPATIPRRALNRSLVLAPDHGRNQERAAFARRGNHAPIASFDRARNRGSAFAAEHVQAQLAGTPRASRVSNPGRAARSLQLASSGLGADRRAVIRGRPRVGLAPASSPGGGSRASRAGLRQAWPEQG
jgi:hypothetical protein